MDIIQAITRTENRKWLYHFTRASNLKAIAALDRLLPSGVIRPEFSGERRTEQMQSAYEGLIMTLNAHLRIPDKMMAASTTQQQFRAHLDSHVFFWPTLRDCRKMLEMYTRREPEESFAVLAFDAQSLLRANAGSVFLTKYDSGSSPRFPDRCGYRKSLDMFLPVEQLGTVNRYDVPAKVSDIKEVLVADGVDSISLHLTALYADNSTEDIPERWRGMQRPLSMLETPGNLV
ncbi:DUF7002 family protein [Paenibacillus radicis (ex Gao et al. 2016)]|uniref:Uncharacterized protein n=1 Tax=Paenibacillus radicis (ex Gao et al. 2016) TaxID=1737354 RepID=A0A917GX27_9BACL|nr:hypothetical protein [Paenibacillus radicis (ex Gao et al. 2016)]GGG59150.1 hypothetical protein GCM10010918_10390 [Paenibacillus radicis (ex Gao et al. 2016)]